MQRVRKFTFQKRDRIIVFFGKLSDWQLEEIFSYLAGNVKYSVYFFLVLVIFENLTSMQHFNP